MEGVGSARSTVTNLIACPCMRTVSSTLTSMAGSKRIPSAVSQNGSLVPACERKNGSTIIDDAMPHIADTPIDTVSAMKLGP